MMASSRRESDFVRMEQMLREAEERTERILKEAEERAERERQLRKGEEQMRKEADERTEQERQLRKEEEQLRKEEEQKRKEEEQKRKEEEQKRKEEEKKTKKMTFEEYLRACHTHLSKPFRAQKNAFLATKSFTSPNNRRCPTLIKPWQDFPMRQQELFERLCQYIPSDLGYFNSLQFIKELGPNICDRAQASEKDLEVYQRPAVEQPVTKIISYLSAIEKARTAFHLDQGIMFENHANTLDDMNEEVQSSLQALDISSKSSSTKPHSADQICVFKQADGTNILCMLVEYKPAHKLSIHTLRAGLERADHGSMDVLNDVVYEVGIPTDPEGKFVYHAELRTASVLTQTYGYMLENGLEFSQITTGEAYVFLRIKENEPHTLYYHLAEPNIEAEAHDAVDILLCRTAISQALTFCLMALDSKPRSQEWRNKVLDNADRFLTDPEAILRNMPPDDKKIMTPPPSAYHARIHSFERSPIKLRLRKSRKVNYSCGTAETTIYKDPESPTGSSDEPSDTETPSKPRTNARQARAKQKNSAKSSQADGSTSRQYQYCTQACLLGLVQERVFDDSCPNVSTHRSQGNSKHHALTAQTLAKLMTDQLTNNLDQACEPLGKQGARGALFKLTLLSHGYTFVAKGTVLAFKSDLQHEGSIYRHLEPLQGQLIPVYLGNISLTHPYFLAVGVRIIHMLLLSYGGEEVDHDAMARLGKSLPAERRRVEAKMVAWKVEHGDIREANLLWNEEVGGVMVIDFERSEIRKKRVLQESSGNLKRKVDCFEGDVGLD